jgi:alkylhydroperoxidase family enzyme
LDDSNFSPALKYKLGLLISEEIGSIYCVSKFAQDARNAGLTEKEIARARLSKSDDPKEQALLTFTSLLISRQGDLRKDEVQAARFAGSTDTELVEACGQIALNYLAGLVVKFAKPEIDYPLERINNEYRTLWKTEPLFTIY